MIDYVLVGQDKRLEELNQLLKQAGKQTVCAQSEKEMEQLKSLSIEKETVCVTGKIPKEIETALEKKGAVFFHMLTDERCRSFNAVATAEGAIAHAMILSQWNIDGSEAVVLGFGVCGSVLAEKLKALGANTTVVVRRKETARLACANGYQTLNFEEFEQQSAKFQYLFNSVPAMVIPASVIGQLRKDSVIIDIASGAGGVDYEAAMAAHIKAVQILRIPGRFASKSSAKKLYEILTDTSKKQMK